MTTPTIADIERVANHATAIGHHDIALFVAGYLSAVLHYDIDPTSSTPDRIVYADAGVELHVSDGAWYRRRLAATPLSVGTAYYGLGGE